jgi:phosphoribosylglycinamide formyltransferase 1
MGCNMDLINKNKPKVIVFASGSKDGGGSGFQNLVLKSRENTRANFEVVAVVSNHENGGVRQKADNLSVPFIHLDKDHRTPEDYERVVKESGAEWVALSGWLKLVPMKDGPNDPNPGLDPRRTINIHPGPLPQFGGAGMYGHFVHEAVTEAYKRGELTHSAVSMHFATKKYDEGPKFLHYPVLIEEGDTTESLSEKVNKAEHEIQPIITSMIVNGEISWDGKDPKSLKVPENYQYL